MAGFHEQMSYTPPQVKPEKEEKFDDIIKSLVNVLITDKHKANYISTVTRNNAKGVAELQAKNSFLKKRFGFFEQPVFNIEGRQSGYKYLEFDRAVSESLIDSVLSLYPAITGKRAEMIADMLKSTASDASQQHLANKLFSNMQGNNMFRR